MQKSIRCSTRELLFTVDLKPPNRINLQSDPQRAKLLTICKQLSAPLAVNGENTEWNVPLAVSEKHYSSGTHSLHLAECTACSKSSEPPAKECTPDTECATCNKRPLLALKCTTRSELSALIARWGRPLAVSGVHHSQWRA
jgi:hypothetical protein